jgi:hypothetical protein
MDHVADQAPRKILRRLRRARSWLAAGLIAVLAGCASTEIRDIPPLLQIRQLEVLDDAVQLALRLRNPNEIAIDVERLAFTLSLDDQPFADYDGRPDVDVVPNSAEEFRLRIVPRDAAALAALRAFTAAGEGSVSWHLEGRLDLAQSIDGRLDQRGRLFPAPGRDNLLR